MFTDVYVLSLSLSLPLFLSLPLSLVILTRYFNVNEFAFVTFMYSHALIPAPAYEAARVACGWETFLSDCEKDFTHPTRRQHKRPCSTFRLRSTRTTCWSRRATSRHRRRRRLPTPQRRTSLSVNTHRTSMPCAKNMV